MDFKQIIFWAYDTEVTDGIQRSIQLRIMLESRDPLKGVRRGLWDSSISYAVDDFVYTVDGTTHVPTRWYCIQANSGNDPTATSSAYWTKADHFEWAYTDDPTKVLILPGPSRRIQGRPSPISAHPTKEQGKLTPESFEITMLDTFEITEAYDGTGASVGPIDFLSTDFKSLLNQVFNNPQALSTWSWNQIVDNTAVYSDYADATKFDMFWMGDSQNDKNSTPEEIDFAEEGSNALQLQQVRITVDSFQARASSYTVRDFLDVTSESDYDVQTFFGNYVAKEGENVANDSYGSGLPIIGHNGGGIFESLGLSSSTPDTVQAAIAANTINDKLHYAAYEDLIVLMFAVMGWTTDPTKWTSNMQPWGDTTNQTSRKIESSRVGYYSGHTWMATTGVCFEHVFSCDPRCGWAVQEASFSVGNSWDTPLSGVLEKWARQWVCKFDPSYDQTAKQPLVLLTDLFAAAVLVTDATTATVSTGDVTISVTDAAALFAASEIIEIDDGLNIEYAIATAGVGTTLTLYRPYPIAFGIGAVVNAIQTIPSALKGRGSWLHQKTVKEPPVIGAGHVEAKSATDDDILGSPHLRGAPIPIEIAQESKAFAPINTVTQYKTAYETYNGNLAADKQESVWKSFVGGRQGRCIIADDATVTLYDNSQPHYNLYTVQSNNSTFWSLNKWVTNDFLASFWDDPTTDVVFFSNGAFGVVLWNPTTDNMNEIMILVNQFQSINPPTGSSQTITVGFEGPHTTSSSTSVGTFALTAGLTVANLSSTGAIPDQNIFKNYYVGMQFVFPKYGIFTLKEKGAYSGGLTPLTFDRAFPFTDAAAIGFAGGPSLNPDCAFGKYMFYENTLDKRYHPYLYDGSNTHRYFEMFMPHTNIYPPTSGFFSGAYTVNRLVYGLPDGTTNLTVPDVPPDDNHGCASYTIAQVNAEFSIGNLRQVTRYYNGVTGPDGRISSVRNGMMWYERRESDTDHPIRFFQVLGRDIDPFALGRGETVLHCIEKKPRSNISRNKVWVKGRNTSSGGASSVGGASGVEGGGVSGPASTGTVDLGAALLQKPNTTSRNRATSAKDGVIPLEAQRRSAVNTDPLFALWDSDATTNLSAFDFNGNLYLRQGTLTLANGATNHNLDISTYASYLIAGPTGAFTITGFAKPQLDAVDAYRLPVTIVNTVAQTLTLSNNDSLSSAGNRLRIPGGSVTLAQHESFTVEYDLTNHEWIVALNKAPVTLPTDLVKTDPTTGDNIIQPVTNGVPAARFKNKSGDTGHNTEWYDNTGTLQGYVSYAGEPHFLQKGYFVGVDAGSQTITSVASPSAGTDAVNKNYADSTYVLRAPGSAAESTIAPTGNTVGFTVNLPSGATADLAQFKFNGTLKTSINFAGVITCPELIVSTSGSGIDVASSATAASATIIFRITNTGTGGRGQVEVNADGSNRFGPLTDTQNNLAKAFAISSNLLRPSRSLNANTTLDATDTGADVDTSGGNKTITLPAHTTIKGGMYIIRKASAANTLTVAESGGGNIKAWTALSEMHIFFSFPNGWGVL